MKPFFESKNVRAVIFILGGVAALLLVLYAGIAVGYRRASFSCAWGENYSHNFFGSRPFAPDGIGGPAAAGDMMQRGPLNPHGVAGEVIDVGSSSFAVKDADNDERSIAVNSGTVIREADQMVTVDQIAPGNQVIVIGAPNVNGQVEARFVRVFAP